MDSYRIMRTSLGRKDGDSKDQNHKDVDAAVKTSVSASLDKKEGKA